MKLFIFIFLIHQSNAVLVNPMHLFFFFTFITFFPVLNFLRASGFVIYILERLLEIFQATLY